MMENFSLKLHINSKKEFIQKTHGLNHEFSCIFNNYLTTMLTNFTGTAIVFTISFPEMKF